MKISLEIDEMDADRLVVRMMKNLIDDHNDELKKFGSSAMDDDLIKAAETIIEWFGIPNEDYSLDNDAV